MKKPVAVTRLSALARIYWFCVLPHFVVLSLIAVAALCYFYETGRGSISGSTPESGFAGLLLWLVIPLGAVAIGILLSVGLASFALSFIPWRGRVVAFLAGLTFIIAANASLILAFAYSLK